MCRMVLNDYVIDHSVGSSLASTRFVTLLSHHDHVDMKAIL